MAYDAHKERSFTFRDFNFIYFNKIFFSMFSCKLAKKDLFCLMQKLNMINLLG